MGSPGWSSQCSPAGLGLHNLHTVPVWGLRAPLMADLGPGHLSGPGDSSTCPVKLVSEGYPHVSTAIVTASGDVTH